MSSLIKMLAVLGVFLFAYSEPIELMNNGDFENPLTTGWQEEINNIRGFSEITRETTYNPDDDYEARIYKEETFFASLFQTVPIPSLDLDFKANYCFTASASDAQVPSIASINVEYLDAAGITLGKTIFYASQPEDMYGNDPVTAVYPVEMGVWATRSFNVQQAVADLSGVNPDLITQIKISLYTKGDYKKVNCST